MAQEKKKVEKDEVDRIQCQLLNLEGEHLGMYFSYTSICLKIHIRKTKNKILTTKNIYKTMQKITSR